MKYSFELSGIVDASFFVHMQTHDQSIIRMEACDDQICLWMETPSVQQREAFLKALEASERVIGVASGVGDKWARYQF